MERTSQTSHSSRTAQKHDAIALLTQDHKKVKDLFEEFKELKEEEGNEEQKEDIVKQLCMELTVHAQIEEEIFYPAAREVIEEEDLLDEAYVEHAGVKELISQLEDMDTNDEFYDAKVTVLSEYVEHHVKEEEGQIFPMIKKAKVDIAALGEEIGQRKEELMADYESGRSKPGKKSSRSS